MRPGIRRIGSHINRDISDNLNAKFICVLLQGAPLLRKFVLEEAVEIRLLFRPAFPVRYGFRFSEPDLIGPFEPASSAHLILDCHEETVIVQPESVFPAEFPERIIGGYIASFKSLLQERETVLIKLLIIHPALIVLPEVRRPDFLLRHKTFLQQSVQVNEIRISRECGKRLVRRIPVSCRTQRENLPETLSGFPDLADYTPCAF